MATYNSFKDLFEFIIYKYVEKEERLKRLKERELKRYGNRIEFEGDLFNKYNEFIKWASEYEDGGMDMRSKRSEEKWIEEFKGQIIKIIGNKTIDEEMQYVIKEIEKKRPTTAST